MSTDSQDYIRDVYNRAHDTNSGIAEAFFFKQNTLTYEGHIRDERIVSPALEDILEQFQALANKRYIVKVHHKNLFLL